MKKIYIVLSASIIINILLVIGLIGQRMASSRQKNEVQNLTLQKKQLNEQLSNGGNNQDNYTIKNNVRSLFYAEFNYNNQTYVSRFTEIKKYVTDDVYKSLQGAGGAEAPKTPIQNKVNSLNIYLTDTNTDTAKALVSINTTYSVNGSNSAPVSQIYEVEVIKQGSNYIVNKITLMGSFAPYESGSSKGVN
ncbi:hypothetical protein ACJDU8_21145 [Clostridium sp. WILCCON 0269]|uniref:Uncharacterized protein n=1 Tax=Candidatus Clostridium eludens TaxID=3381663 RepID=A0ABW8SPP6_9CLOT